MVSFFSSRSKPVSNPPQEVEDNPPEGAAKHADMRHHLEQWRRSLEQQSQVKRNSASYLNLTGAHPGGMAQLYSLRPTRLSSLVREKEAYENAVRIVHAQRADIAQSMRIHGGATLHMGIGSVRWNGAEDTQTSPLLLHPVLLSADEAGEPLLTLHGEIEVAPAVLRAVRAVGRNIDTEQVRALTLQEHGFTPTPALAQLRNQLGACLPGFEMREELVVGMFLSATYALEQELTTKGDQISASPLVQALAGDAHARAQIPSTLPESNPNDRDPWHELGVGDQLPETLDQVEAAAAGVNLMLETASTTGASPVVASMLAAGAKAGKRVMYVSGDQPRSTALMHELDQAGLDHAYARLTATLEADEHMTSALGKIMSGNVALADANAIESTREQLKQVRDRLSSHTYHLHKPFPQWGISAYDALQVLTDLTGARPGPRTKVRFNAQVLTKLAQGGAETAKEALIDATRQRIFTNGDSDPWFGIIISSPEQVRPVVDSVAYLSRELLPDLRVNMSAAAGQTGLLPATTVAQWEEQLDMLDGVRDCLDVFQPAIFESSVADMVIATASRNWRRENGVEMKRSLRKRLTKQAKDLLRPGRYVEDLHEELRKVQKQRDVWRRYCEAGGWPKLPTGLTQMNEHAQTVRGQLEKLSPYLGSAYGDLTQMDINELSLLLDSLNRDRAGASALPERIRTLKTLHNLGLDALVKDLRARKVPDSMVEKELDLAWWASALGVMLAAESSLGGFDPSKLTLWIEQFRALDEAQVKSLAVETSDAIQKQRGRAMARWANQDAQLREELAAGALTMPAVDQFRELELVRDLFPILITTPVLVPLVTDLDEPLDLVVIDAVEKLPVAELVPIVARAKQLVVVVAGGAQSESVEALQPLLARTQVYPRPQHVNEHVAKLLGAYSVPNAGAMVPVPRAGSALSITFVDGRGMPAPGATAVESSKEEVDAVVDLVVEHALMHPEESLAVATLSSVHADRVRAAVMDTVQTSPALATFFDQSNPEPFCVITPEDATGVRRDRVILSVGFAKTPHGRVLHNFGRISSSEGLELLARVLMAAGEKLHIVSAVHPEDFDRDRFGSDGPRMLLDLLSMAQGTQVQNTDWPTTQAAPDQLLIDLADRLYNVGVTVIPNLGVEGSFRIPLALGHPQLPGELLVAVLTDDAHYVNEPSLRRRDRFWPALLEEYGWSVRTELAMVVFIDPQKEADTILNMVMDALERRVGTDVDAAADAPGSNAESDAYSQVPEPIVVDDDDEELVEPGMETAAMRRVRMKADAQIHGGEHVWEAPNRGREQELKVARGLPLAAYSDDQLDDVARWVRSDGKRRTTAQMVEELTSAIGLTRRGAPITAVLTNVVMRTNPGGNKGDLEQGQASEPVGNAQSVESELNPQVPASESTPTAPEDARAEEAAGTSKGSSEAQTPVEPPEEPMLEFEALSDSEWLSAQSEDALDEAVDNDELQGTDPSADSAWDSDD